MSKVEYNRQNKNNESTNFNKDKVDPKSIFPPSIFEDDKK